MRRVNCLAFVGIEVTYAENLRALHSEHPSANGDARSRRHDLHVHRHDHERPGAPVSKQLPLPVHERRTS